MDRYGGKIRYGISESLLLVQIIIASPSHTYSVSYYFSKVDETIVFTKNIEEHLGFDNTTTIDDRKGSTNKNVNKSSFSQHPIICQIGGSNPDLAGDVSLRSVSCFFLLKKFMYYLR